MAREWEVDWTLQEEVRGINVEFQGLPVQEIQNEPEQSLSSPWVTLSSAASADVYGDYEELIASTSLPGTWVLVQMMAGAGFAQNIFIRVDIAIGPMGSEVNFVEEMMHPQTTPGVGANAQQDWSFPFFIPAGSRLSARSKDEKTDSRDILILVHVHGK